MITPMVYNGTIGVFVYAKQPFLTQIVAKTAKMDAGSERVLYYGGL
jgi:hypothetical protein